MSYAYGQKRERERKTKLNTLTSKCATEARICQWAAHSDNKCVQRHTIHSNRLHRLAVAELCDRECCLNNSWGEKASEPPAAGHSPTPLPFAPTLREHFHHLLREESLMGFRGKYQTKATDSPAADRFVTSILFPGCYMNYATVYTVAQESAKVSGTWVESNLLVLGTMDKQRSKSTFMVRIEDSWRPQSPAVFACVKCNYLAVSCILWLSMEHVPRSWSVCSSWQS